MSRISPADISDEGPQRVSRERSVISGTRCLSSPLPPFHLLVIFSPRINDQQNSGSWGSSETGRDRRRRADRSGKGFEIWARRR